MYMCVWNSNLHMLVKLPKNYSLCASIFDSPLLRDTICTIDECQVSYTEMGVHEWCSGFWSYWKRFTNSEQHTLVVDTQEVITARSGGSNQGVKSETA